MLRLYDLVQLYQLSVLNYTPFLNLCNISCSTYSKVHKHMHIYDILSGPHSCCPEANLSRQLGPILQH